MDDHDESKTGCDHCAEHKADRDAAIARAEAAEADRERYSDILMGICHALEIPRCEDGPCDDGETYIGAIRSLEQECAKEIERREKAEKRENDRRMVCNGIIAQRDAAQAKVAELERLFAEAKAPSAEPNSDKPISDENLAKWERLWNEMPNMYGAIQPLTLRIRVAEAELVNVRGESEQWRRRLLAAKNDHLDTCAAIQDINAGFDNIRDCDCKRNYVAALEQRDATSKDVRTLMHKVSDLENKLSLIRDKKTRGPLHARLNATEQQLDSAVKQRDALAAALSQISSDCHCLDPHSNLKPFAMGIAAIADHAIAVHKHS